MSEIVYRTKCNNVARTYISIASMAMIISIDCIYIGSVGREAGRQAGRRLANGQGRAYARAGRQAPTDSRQAIGQ